MGTRLSNNIAKRKYLDRNKLFLNFRSGDLVEINLNDVSGRSFCKLRTITKNDKGSFTYHDSYRETFNSGQIGLFLGRYAGEAVVLLNEGMYAINVACIKKVEGNNG